MQKQKYPSRTILMDKNYPIGHATGLSKSEWEQFAKTYVPFSERSEPKG